MCDYVCVFMCVCDYVCVIIYVCLCVCDYVCVCGGRKVIVHHYAPILSPTPAQPQSGQITASSWSPTHRAPVGSSRQYLGPATTDFLRFESEKLTWDLM